MNPWYKDFSEYLEEKFPGMKVQKLSIDAGFSCPNRDGTIGRGGCIYCDNRSFTPRYCSPRDSIAEQIEKGRRFFARKYPEMKYLAYFQSFTATHSAATDLLRDLYEEAIRQKDVVGLIIGTRPDTLPLPTLRLLKQLNRQLPVIVEIGAETSHDRTLNLINRCHTWRQTEEAVLALTDNGIECGLHLIVGLPGETEEDILLTVERCCKLPISTLKLHQLQIIRDTPLHHMWLSGEVKIREFSVDEYLDLCCHIVKVVGGRVALERFLASAPLEMVITPKWGLKNYQFTQLLHGRLRDAAKSSNR